jgi:hypothetical protein
MDETESLPVSVRNVIPEIRQRLRPQKPSNGAECKRAGSFSQVFSGSRGAPDGAAGPNFSWHNLVDITPDPAFTGLDGANQRVLCATEVLGRVLILRRIAAADVAARQTQAEMNPCISRLAALFANMGFRVCKPDLIQMRTFGPHTVPIMPQFAVRICQLPSFE